MSDFPLRTCENVHFTRGGHKIHFDQQENCTCASVISQLIIVFVICYNLYFSSKTLPSLLYCSRDKTRPHTVFVRAVFVCIKTMLTIHCEKPELSPFRLAQHLTCVHRNVIVSRKQNTECGTLVREDNSFIIRISLDKRRQFFCSFVNQKTNCAYKA